jgi:DNA-binding LytR/AlgR family response regulator
LFFGVSTTALLNHLTKGYVTKAYLSTPAALVNADASSSPSTQQQQQQHQEGQQEQEPARQKLILHTYNLLTRTRREEVDVDDIHAPQTIMPYVTFHSERNRKNYCLEYTAFEDKDLWHELFPFANRE